MSFNLLDAVKDLVPANLTSAAASAFGESEGGIQKALTGAIPSILAGLFGKTNNPAGATSILDLAKQAAGSGILNNPGGLMGSDSNSLLSKGAGMLSSLFGDKAAGVAGLVSNFAGIKESSASSVLSVVAPLALGAVGKYANEKNLTAGGLADFIASQKNTIMNALPPGFGTFAAFSGIGSVSQSESHPVGTATAHTHASAMYTPADEDPGSGNMKFLLPLLLAVFAVALGIYFFKGCGNGIKETAPKTDTVVQAKENAPDSHAGHAHARELFKVKLPNDTVLEAYRGGIEDKLVSFLGTDYKILGEDSLKKVWFDFDNLNFETASANITAESQEQVNNIAAILKAFPSVKIKIGGYADKVGDEANNKKLSAERARSVQAALSAAGVGSQVTSAEGYGAEFAVFAADAPETDRIKDRHVSVSVR
ncbi:MAG: OmpA family protein [Chitinophagaceae bacterium]